MLQKEKNIININFFIYPEQFFFKPNYLHTFFYLSLMGEELNEEITVNLMSSNGSRHSITVFKNQKISELIELAEKKLDAPKEDFKLVFLGKELNQDETVGSSNIEDGVTIQVFPRKRTDNNQNRARTDQNEQPPTTQNTRTRAQNGLLGDADILIRRYIPTNPSNILILNSQVTLNFDNANECLDNIQRSLTELLNKTTEMRQNVLNNTLSPTVVSRYSVGFNLAVSTVTESLSQLRHFATGNPAERDTGNNGDESNNYARPGSNPDDDSEEAVDEIELNIIAEVDESELGNNI